ncbi:MAG TPA: LysR family transcriptional regulator [Sphingomonas sp.]|jgi:DNA-binding transcriptional LysR family regulator
MIDWTDVRFFLAVADSGSTTAAGRKLRVSQTTAARRVAALEEALGLALFDRRQAGYRATPAGEALIASARGVAEAAAAFGSVAAALTRDLTGTVRLTASAVFADTILAPILRDLHHAHPTIVIEVDTCDELRDLGNGTADVAIRSCVQPTGDGLVGRRFADDCWTVYCSRDYAAAHGRPEGLATLADHQFVGGGQPGVWRHYREWLTRHGLEGRVAVTHGSSTGMLAAVRAGAGLAVLPCFVADRDPALLRCLPPVGDPKRGLWLLTHERVRRTPRVRTVIDFIAACLREPALHEPAPMLPTAC